MRGSIRANSLHLGELNKKSALFLFNWRWWEVRVYASVSTRQFRTMASGTVSLRKSLATTFMRSGE